MKNKVVTAEEAIALINDGDVVCTTGFVQSCIPEMLHAALEKRHVETKGPNGLTLIMCAGAGDSKGLGTGRLHHEGLLTRVIAANFGRMPKVAEAAHNNKIQAYNLPQGIISKLYRSCASGQPASSPRSACIPTSILVSRRQGQRDHDGRHRQARRDRWRGVAVLQGDPHRRGADPRDERRSGRQPQHGEGGADARLPRPGDGRAQQRRHRHRAVERVVAHGSLKPKDVRVPGILVDCVVVADPPRCIA